MPVPHDDRIRNAVSGFEESSTRIEPPGIGVTRAVPLYHAAGFLAPHTERHIAQIHRCTVGV
jgi:hypothetical protein